VYIEKSLIPGMGSVQGFNRGWLWTVTHRVDRIGTDLRVAPLAGAQDLSTHA
jgi:hypothetical protein